MAKKLCIVCIGLAIVLGMSSTAFGDIIYGDFEYDNAVASYFNGSGGIFAAAPFVLGATDNVVSDIHWLGTGIDPAQNGMADDNFLVAILGDNGAGLPDSTSIYFVSQPAPVDRAFVGNIGGILDLYAYSMYLNPLVLNPGQTYHLMITNILDSEDDVWAWLYQGGEDYFSISAPPSTDWVPLGGSLAFLLTNDLVPEPASMTLLGLGLLGVGIRRYRKSR